jgi:hypothetical protein
MGVTPLLIFLYMVGLILSTACFAERGVSSHVHHSSPTVNHSAGCFLACENAVAEKVPQPPPYFFILLFGLSIFCLIFIRSLQTAWNNRAPPLS